MDEFLINALQGVVASGPVAILLMWRLKKADDRIKDLEGQLKTVNADQTKFLKGLAGVEE